MKRKRRDQTAQKDFDRTGWRTRCFLLVGVAYFFDGKNSPLQKPISSSISFVVGLVWVWLVCGWFLSFMKENAIIITNKPQQQQQQQKENDERS